MATYKNCLAYATDGLFKGSFARLICNLINSGLDSQKNEFEENTESAELSDQFQLIVEILNSVLQSSQESLKIYKEGNESNINENLKVEFKNENSVKTVGSLLQSVVTASVIKNFEEKNICSSIFYEDVEIGNDFSNWVGVCLQMEANETLNEIHFYKVTSKENLNGRGLIGTGATLPSNCTYSPDVDGIVIEQESRKYRFLGLFEFCD